MSLLETTHKTGDLVLCYDSVDQKIPILGFITEIVVDPPEYSVLWVDEVYEMCYNVQQVSNYKDILSKYLEGTTDEQAA